VNGITYDTGALIAAERDSATLWALHRRTLERGLRPTVSTLVLGQAWRGGPQHRLSRLLRGCLIEPFDEQQARSAGAALSASGGRDLVDAAVVMSALAREDMVVSSDPHDLNRIASATGGSLTVHTV
jgi:predicted nucleic acid-binding protein